MQRLRKEKKALRSRWLRATAQEKLGLTKLYDDVKKKLREEMRKDRKIKRRKKREQCRKKFVKDPYKFAKGLFTVCRSGKWECPKEDLENI